MERDEGEVVGGASAVEGETVRSEVATAEAGQAVGSSGAALEGLAARLGRRFMVAMAVALAVGGVLALLVRGEMSQPSRVFMDGAAHLSALKSHGLVMVYLFLLPAISATLGLGRWPALLGTRALAFPTLAKASFWLYVAGAGALGIGVVAGGVDGGWIFFMAYRAEVGTATVFATGLGVVLVSYAAILIALNLVSTVHVARRRGGAPPRSAFVWGLYTSSMVHLAVLPVLVIGITLALVERVVPLGFFDPRYGGDPLLFQHFIWFALHPLLLVSALGPLGLAFDHLSTAPGGAHNKAMDERRRPSVRDWMFAFGLLCVVSWGVRLASSGLSAFSAMVFSASAVLAFVPLLSLVVRFIVRVGEGAPPRSVVTCYAYAVVGSVLLGALSGVLLSMLSPGVTFSTTTFRTGHLHFIAAQSTLFGLGLGLHRGWAAATGRVPPPTWAYAGFGMHAAGALLMGLMFFVMGSRGMPRVALTYEDGFHSLQLLATMGALMIALGLVASGLSFLWARRPAGATSLEGAPSPG